VVSASEASVVSASGASVVSAAGAAVDGVVAAAAVVVVVSSSSLPHAAAMSDRLMTLASARRLFVVFTLMVSLWLLSARATVRTGVVAEPAIR